MPELIQILPINDNPLTANTSTISNVDQKDPKYVTNGTYIVTASSTANDSSQPYVVFNEPVNGNDEQAYWQCDYPENPSYNNLAASYPEYTQIAYTGTTPSSYQGGGSPETTWTTVIGKDRTVDIKGEWIQVQIPSEIYLYKYSVKTPVYSSEIGTFPTKFIVVGSTDGKSWIYIDQQNLKDTDLPEKTRPKKEFNINASQKYNYFRLIISELAKNQTILKINKWELVGVTYITTNKESFTTLSRSIVPYSNTNGYLEYVTYNEIQDTLIPTVQNQTHSKSDELTQPLVVNDGDKYTFVFIIILISILATIFVHYLCK
jgi:hypothetical protein